MPFFRYRYLTAGECSLLRPIFQTALDYAAIRIYPRRFMPLQDARTAMSPNGFSYFPSGIYRTDFSQSDYLARNLFIHECSHIWQHRLGYPVLRCGICLALQGGYIKSAACRYRHLLAQQPHLSQYNMEQQAQIIADYFAGNRQDTILQRVLHEFIRQPENTDLLPQSMKLLRPVED